MIYCVIVSRGGPVTGDVSRTWRDGRLRAWWYALNAWLHGWRVVAIYPVRKH